MAHRRLHRLVLPAGLAVAMLALPALFGADALAALPALLALCLPASGRYVGERGLVRLAARRARRRPRRAPNAPAPRLTSALRALPRGGRLIAARLAWRGPPPALSR
jgi:hypothetical protein